MGGKGKAHGREKTTPMPSYSEGTMHSMFFSSFVKGETPIENIKEGIEETSKSKTHKKEGQCTKKKEKATRRTSTRNSWPQDHQNL